MSPRRGRRPYAAGGAVPPPVVGIDPGAVGPVVVRDARIVLEEDPEGQGEHRLALEQAAPFQVDPEAVTRLRAQFDELAERIRTMIRAAAPAMEQVSRYAEYVQAAEAEQGIRSAFEFPGEEPGSLAGPNPLYDALITSTREHLHDPHGYHMPTTNAMRWSPPADDAEEVPRWLA